MKSLKLYKRIAALLVLSLVAFTGCIPNHYTREEKRAFLNEAGQIAADYLGDTYKGAKIKEIEPETTVLEAGYELTDFASGQFVWRRQVYDFVVNVGTGEIYTSVFRDEVEQRLKEELYRELGIAIREEKLVSCHIYYLKGCKDSRTGEEISSPFDNVFPEGETVDDLVRKILEDEEEYLLAMDFQYKGDDLPSRIMEESAPFPTMASLGIYHVAEGHGLYDGEYNYLVLPSLSEEILWRGYLGDCAEYTRNQVMERDGFQIVYNAYERIKEQDTVEERVIDAEDILFTVTDDYISLDCTKDNFIMYLSADDKKTARKYCYTYGSAVSGGKFQIGTWYSYEGRYIYSDMGGGIPDKFYNHNREANTIYTKQAMEALQDE